MFAPSREPENNRRPTAVVERPRHRARRMITSALVVRSKEDLAPPTPLPRWTNWLLVGWMFIAVAAYTAILTGAWR